MRPVPNNLPYLAIANSKARTSCCPFLGSVFVSWRWQAGKRGRHFDIWRLSLFQELICHFTRSCSMLYLLVTFDFAAGRVRPGDGSSFYFPVPWLLWLPFLAYRAILWQSSHFWTFKTFPNCALWVSGKWFRSFWVSRTSLKRTCLSRDRFECRSIPSAEYVLLE